MAFPSPERSSETQGHKALFWLYYMGCMALLSWVVKLGSGPIYCVNMDLTPDVPQISGLFPSLLINYQRYQRIASSITRSEYRREWRG
jgi:hypothetical protein